MRERERFIVINRKCVQERYVNNFKIYSINYSVSIITQAHIRFSSSKELRIIDINIFYLYTTRLEINIHQFYTTCMPMMISMIERDLNDSINRKFI